MNKPPETPAENLPDDQRADGFYLFQERLIDGLYLRQPGPEDEDRVDLLRSVCGIGPFRILELGAGGGQTAFLTACRGHSVTALEAEPRFVDHAMTLVPDVQHGELKPLVGDFLTVPLEGPFDLVTYWDGFGTGQDEAQRRLLMRISGWLAADGRALIDIYNPVHAIRQEGREMIFGAARRRYEYDAFGNRWVDTWWHEDRPEDCRTQTLRCYSPADLRLLLAGTGLFLDDVILGGSIDHDARVYHKTAPELAAAIWYTAILRPEDRS